jgi:hypothetical protein
LDRAGWGLVPHQQQPNMLLLIPSRHTTLSNLIFCLIRSQKANSYPFDNKTCFGYPDGNCLRKWALQYVGLQLKSYIIRNFRFIRVEKAMSYLFYLWAYEALKVAEAINGWLN